MTTVKLLVLTAALAIFAVACSQASNTPAPNTAKANANTQAAPVPAATLDEMAVAKDLYTVHCMTCHKDSGKGGPVTVDGKKLDPEDLTGDKMKGKSDEKLKEYITDGVVDEGMPAFKDKLSDAEIVSMVRYVRVLQGK